MKHPTCYHGWNPWFRVTLATLVLSLGAITRAAEPVPLRAGMIGLDTSHVPAFAKIFNSPKATGDLAGIKVVAGYPGGTEIPASRDRVKGFTEQLRGMGIEIVDTIHKEDFGAIAFGNKGIVQAGREGGYEELCREIGRFFKTRIVPVPPEETIEIFAFMEAADESKRQGGAPVSLASVLAKAQAEAATKRRE